MAKTKLIETLKLDATHIAEVVQISRGEYKYSVAVKEYSPELDKWFLDEDEYEAELFKDSIDTHNYLEWLQVKFS